MPANPIADQSADGDAGYAMALLANPILDPLFRPQARCGIASAWHAHVPFAQWLVSVMRPSLIVELGTHNGISYAAFCETVLRERLATRCYAVDTWAGDDHAGHYDESVYAQLREFHDGRYSAFSELLRMTFDEAREVIADGTVDLLHIDGFHTYDAVRRDFEGWVPKLSRRAVVLFHDTNVLERGFGVARFWAEVESRLPSFAFLHGHGLGVLAVGPDVPPPIDRLCATVTPAAVAVLRERFAALGRVHALDFAVRETARHEQRLRREAAERDRAVDSLRRSLDEVVHHRENVLAAHALAEQRLLAQEASIASLQQAQASHEAVLQREVDQRDRVVECLRGSLEEAQTALDDARGQAARQETAAADRDQIIGGLRAEIEALRGNLAAARADGKAAGADGRAEAARLQAEIDKRDGELSALRSAAEPERMAGRAMSGLRSRRH